MAYEENILLVGPWLRLEDILEIHAFHTIMVLQYAWTELACVAMITISHNVTSANIYVVY